MSQQYKRIIRNQSNGEAEDIVNDSFDKMILGTDPRCMISMDSHKTQLNNNVMVVGGSGSGKTSSITNNMLLNVNHTNIVGVFSKRGIVDIARSDMEHRGYKTYLLDFSKPENSTISFDPLLMCQDDSDVRELAKCIVYKNVAEGSTSNDRFWDYSAENLIYLVLKYVWQGLYTKGRSMKEALYLLDHLVYWEDYDENMNMFDRQTIVSEEIDLDVLDKENYGFIEWKKGICILHDIDFDSIGGYGWETDELRARCLVKSRIKTILANRDSECKNRMAYPLHFEFHNLRETMPELYSIWKSFIDYPSSTGGCVAGTIQTFIQNAFSPSVRGIINNQEVLNLDMMMKSKQALFVMMSPVSASQNKMIEILYRMTFKGLFERAERMPDAVLPYPVHFICDDFAAGCHVPNFPEMISIFREKRISVTLLIQSESQLAAIYGKDEAITIINNCDTYIFMGGMDLATCESISKRINMPVTKILYMEIGDEIFIRRGMQPFYTKRYNYLEDESYKVAVRRLQEENSMKMSTMVE